MVNAMLSPNQQFLSVLFLVQIIFSVLLVKSQIRKIGFCDVCLAIERKNSKASSLYALMK